MAIQFSELSTIFAQAQKKYRKEALPVWIYGYCSGLAEENLPVIVYREYCLALGTTETASLRRLELLRADRAGKDLRENLGFDLHSAGFEKIDGIGKGILDIEELGKAQQLEYFVYLGLDLEQDDISALRFDRFQKRGKRTDTGRRNVVEGAAAENQADIPRFHDLGYTLLKETRIIRIDIAIKE